MSIQSRKLCIDEKMTCHRPHPNITHSSAKAVAKISTTGAALAVLLHVMPKP
jgi:hypothetical protein